MKLTTTPLFLTWNEIQERKTPENYRVMFHGIDAGDKYAIVCEDNEEKDIYHFIMFHHTDNEEIVAEHNCYDNPVEAAMWMSFRFMLDNADDPDSFNESAVVEWNKHRRILRDLMD